ncbi:MAG: arginine deiminase-related protein, partial [Bacteroidota bacterium]
FFVDNKIQLEHYESQDRFLEGTGSIILDRVHKIAYACVSKRTDEGIFQEFCQYVNYEAVLFHACDAQQIPIYHTNVMMALGTDYVVICMESITDAAERSLLRQKFETTGKTVIELTLEQMNAFAGNMLEVRNTNGDTMLVMSEQAYLSLDDNQIIKISSHTDILYAPIYTIEKYGGGSVRCMMAEIFLKEKQIIKVENKKQAYTRVKTKTVIEKYDPEKGWIRIQ